jgi:hypothetical protein
MTDRLRIPKGRQTIRKNGSLTGTHGPVSRPINRLVRPGRFGFGSFRPELLASVLRILPNFV